MQITKHKTNDVLELAGVLDIGVSAELRQALQTHLGSSANPQLDLSAVDTCDTTALQLLCSATRSAAFAGKTLEIVKLSPAVADACATLGLTFGARQGNEAHAL
jgi:anti-anti-sigma factor